MKKLSLIIALFTATLLMGRTMHSKNGIIEKKEGSITFVVDEGLEPTQHDQYHHLRLMDGEKAAEQFLAVEHLPGELNIVATSFADEQGQTLDKIPHTENMVADRVRVNFKYQIIDRATGEVISETPMELWAGFVGFKEDMEANTLTPKIGWLVRIGDEEEDAIREMEKWDTERGGIHLRVKEVPAVLAELKHIKRLELEFTDKVVLPEWMDEQTIESFYITGSMTDEEEEAIRKRFPKAGIERIPNKKEPTNMVEFPSFDLGAFE